MSDTESPAVVNSRVRIMIVDDHPIVRHGLSVLIKAEPDLEICAEADGCQEALEILRKSLPDLLVVDIQLGDGNGIDLIKQVRSLYPSLKVLVTSMYDEGLFAERALRAGAMGYVNKQEATHDLVSAIRQVLRGKISVSAKVADRALSSGPDGVAKSGVESLSDRELEVFEMIGQGLATRVIAERLHLSMKTIETHRENIKKKLNLDSNNELIRHAVQWVLQN